MSDIIGNILAILVLIIGVALAIAVGVVLLGIAFALVIAPFVVAGKVLQLIF